MGLTLYLGIERGNIACHKSEARCLTPYCERDASRAGLLEMRPFGEAKSISGHQTLQLIRRPCGVKGSVYVVTLPAFQSDTREQIPHRQEDRRRPSQGTSRPTGNTGETWESNPIRSQRIHRGRDLFSAMKKTEQI
ncbi:hypothetical protein M9H77_23691 [Catharanthus roseus]|uniref:Uncharacterized protein n=1 Tax=Catharanthus roseus TaxID=4058 RepID=A0ACC0AWU3_CATRO|nr:hypothetical protein M9H77_00006 [Catharanthus roseus]KAI5664368.1 hypothetical protein M9H77_23691 [Catharanthus roseus]